MYNIFSRHIALVLLFALLLPNMAMAGDIPLPFGGRIHKTVRSFQEIRQARVVHQNWDFSCGSAALSTLLKFYYNDNVSESAIITSILHRTDPLKVRARGGFSFLDLKRFVERRGYQGKGYVGLTLEELVKMGVPAIISVQVQGYNHFVVFRGMRGNRVVFADPTYGTTTMKSEQFLEIWKSGFGFLVYREGAMPASNNLAPEKEDFCLPEGTAITRSLMRTGVIPLTRNGL